jgi:HEAT repeat protein
LRALVAGNKIAVVRVERIARIDRHGYRAQVRVERAVHGTVAPGTSLEIAWEELAQGRAPRFARGEEVVVALGPLPDTSLWLNRFPPQLRTGQVLAVAASGEAFARSVDPRDLAALEELARYVPSEVHSLGAAFALASLLVARDPRLAETALALLDEEWIEAYRSDPTLAERCSVVFEDQSLPAAFRERVIEWAARRQIRTLVPALTRLAESDDPLAPSALEALERLGVPLSAESLERWLTSTDPAARARAVRKLRGSEAAARLRRFATSDPAPEVRASALEALRGLEREKAFEVFVACLGDPAPEVRLAAGRQLAALGEAVRTRLEEWALTAQGDAALSAVAAFEAMGAPGRVSLARIAREHAEERVRTFANLALGKAPSEHGTSP